MQCSYSEINGHVLANRGESSRTLFRVDHDDVHPLKRGLHTVASFVVLTASLSAMYFMVLVVSDMQETGTFLQNTSVATLDRDFKSAGHHVLPYSHDV